MAAVTENYPKTEQAYNAKSDQQSVPSGADDKWVDAQDIDKLSGPLKALQRAFRLYAAVMAVAPDTAGVNAKVFRFTGIDATTTLGDVSTTLTTELNKQWAAAMEKIEQEGDLDGTASAGGLFGVHTGLVSVASGAFATGALLRLSSDGGLLTYVSGNLPPIGICIDATTCYLDLTGRVRADGSTIDFDTDGKLRALAAGLDHGTLAGLADDDHTQYILASGTRAFTGVIKRFIVAGITAFATGGQASATALTAEINEIATCATAGDSGKLLTATAGLVQTVINNGAQACDVFPNTGDNLGAGVDTAVSLAAGANITYAAYDATNWESI